MVLRIDPETGEAVRKFAGPLPAALGICRSGELLVACGDGVLSMEFSSGRTRALANPIAGQSTARLNDGKVAPDGSFWVGSMQNNIGGDGRPIEITSNIGGFFRISADGGLTTLLPEDLGIANTLAWSPDGQFFYFADSMKGALYRARLTGDGALGEVIPFNTDFPRGVPDGSAMDAEGCLWNARWGGGCIVRFTPEGKVDRTVDLPATNITSCAFGGPELSTLFVTTARSGLDEVQLSENQTEGAVLAVDARERMTKRK